MEIRSEKERLTLPARRLPEMMLGSVPGGARQPLRPGGRTSPVLVPVHGAECAGCRAYLDRLGAAAGEIDEWDGRVSVVVPGSAEAAGLREAAPASFRLLADPDGALAAKLGVRGAAVVIADQYGEIHEATDAGAGHDLPAPEEVVQWLRYLAVQCPECQGEAL